MKSHLLVTVLLPLTILSSCVGSSSPKDLVDSILNPSTQSFPGCVSATAVDSARIKVEYKIPEEATEFFIYRNGTKVAAFSEPAGTYTFIDMDLIEGVSYSYRCEAKILHKIREGENKPSSYTIGINTPNFKGISNFSLVGNSGGRIEWQTPTSSNPAVDNYKIFYNAGPTIDISITPVVVQSGSFVKNISNLGDELTYTASVKACTFQDLCDSNEEIKNITTPDTGAPKSGRITSVVPGDNKTLIIKAPWTNSDGGLKLRSIYVSTASIAPTKLSDYDLLQSYDVPDSQRHAPIRELSVSGIDEDTTYHFVVVDTDPSGKKSKNTSDLVSGFTYKTLDLTPPVFPGITSLERDQGSPEKPQLKYKFKAIPSQPTDSSGASFYKVYVKSNKYPSTASNACEITSSTIPYHILRADGSVTGSDVEGIINTQDRTNYSVCIYAEDAAGNKSGGRAFPHTAENKWAKDFTPPSFTGIKTLNREARAGSEPFLKITWEPSQSDDLSGYKIKLWKSLGPNQLTFDAAKAEEKKEIMVSKSSQFEISNTDFKVSSSETVYAFVEACDDSDTLRDVINGSVKNCTSLGETSKKILVLPNNIDPPAGFEGIKTATVHATDEGAGVVTWAWDPTFTNSYAGFNIYDIDPNNIQSIIKIKTCPCNNGVCPNSCVVSGLNARRTYFFKVEAYNSAGLETNTIHTVSSGYRSFTTLDTTSPTHESTINSIKNVNGKEDLTFSVATDNQFNDQRVRVSGASISDYTNNVSITYELYRKKKSPFQNSTEPFNDKEKDSSTNQPLMSLVQTYQVDSKNPLNGTFPTGTLTNGIFKVSDSGQTDGIDQYYTVCARDSSFDPESPFPLRNRRCNGSVKNVVLKDITPPTLVFVSHTKTNEKLKKWSISFSIKDNITKNSDLLSSMKVYRRYSDKKNDTDSSLEQRLTIAPANMAAQASTLESINVSNLITIYDLRGPAGTLKYVSYRIEISDESGKTTNLNINLNAPSDNRLTATLLGTNEIKKAGGERILIKGSGFSRGLENGFATNTTVRIGNVLCENLAIINSEYLECRFGGDLAVAYDSQPDREDYLQVYNPDGTYATSIKVTVKQDLSSVCDDTSLNPSRPSSFRVAPPARTSNDSQSILGGRSNPYVLCDLDDFQKAMEYHFFANRFTYLKLGTHIDLANLPPNRTFGLLQGANYFEIGVDTSIPAKLDGLNFGIFNFNPRLTSTTRHPWSLYQLDSRLPSNASGDGVQKGFGLFSVIAGNMLIKDLHFIQPRAELTITGNPSYVSGTSIAANAPVSFGFLGGVSFTSTSTIDTNTFNNSASLPNSDMVGPNLHTLGQNRKNLFHNINVIESEVILSTAGTFQISTAYQSQVNNLAIGGILGAGFNLPSYGKTTFNSGTSTDVDRNMTSIVASTSQVKISTPEGSIPLASKIGSMAGSYSGRISDSSGRLIINSNSSGTQAAPTQSFGIGGLVGEYAVTPFICSAASGVEAESVTVANNSDVSAPKHYCGLVRNKVMVNIDLPTYTNIGGLFGVLKSLIYSSDGNLFMSRFAYRSGIIKQEVSGTLKCSTNCGGLWGVSINRASTTYFMADDATTPALVVDSTRTNLNIEGYLNVSGFGAISTAFTNTIGNSCSPSHRCDQGRFVIQKSSVQGSIKCLLTNEANSCNNIGGLISSYTRRCTADTSVNEDNQGTALEILDTEVKPIITIEKKHPIMLPLRIGGVFGEYLDQTPCGANRGLNGFVSKVNRVIAASDIDVIDVNANGRKITTNYHWLSPTITTTTGRTKFQNIVHYNDVYDGTSDEPQILEEYPSKTFISLDSRNEGKKESNYPTFIFPSIWDSNDETVIPYLR